MNAAPAPLSNLYGASDIFRLEVRSHAMYDAIFLVGGFVFFVAAIGYALACERL